MNSTLKKIHKESVRTVFKDLFGHPLYLLSHPIKGFDQFKRENTGKSYVAWFYFGMMILVNIIAFNGNGFLVNKNNPKDFNIFLIIGLVVFPVAIATVANWASTALMDGKGTMTEIFRVIGYSFFPYVWLSLFATIISNFITYEEIIFFHFFNSLGVVLLAYMMFFGLMGIHEFGLMKTIMMFVFTIIAIAAVLFVILLFLSLIQYIYSFIDSVIDEFIWRFW
ncbi:MAG: Yip1 family protein [Bacilli bacterium]|nr:Yip1 family protein [Bacilli bacterium]